MIKKMLLISMAALVVAGCSASNLGTDGPENNITTVNFGTLTYSTKDPSESPVYTLKLTLNSARKLEGTVTFENGSPGCQADHIIDENSLKTMIASMNLANILTYKEPTNCSSTAIVTNLSYDNGTDNNSIDFKCEPSGTIKSVIDLLTLLKQNNLTFDCI